MKLKKKINIPLDEFINLSLYDKKIGYYMKQNPFGKKGDFTTAPNISRLFSEMIAVWIVSFWQNLGSPKNFNLIELGAGNGEMMNILIESFKNFPNFFSACNIYIHEKSPTLIKIQKKKLKGDNVKWIDSINNLKKKPAIFIANEFFDAIPIKQFIKSKKTWFEIYVGLRNDNKSFFFNKKIDMKKFEKKIKFEISYNQNFIEYSKVGLDYLEKISKFIKKNKGGVLIIDYGYFEDQMKNTIQSIYNQKYSNILENIGNCDITHNINFNLFKKIIKKVGGLQDLVTTQKEFLIKLGIKQRAEIISKNLPFSKKADIFFRLKRLIDEKQMGEHFKVMLIKNKNNKSNFGL
jgi:cyclopropane-fatty-acyl-phospholipid synthase